MLIRISILLFIAFSVIGGIAYTLRQPPQKEVDLILPRGFKATVFADNVGVARHIAVASNGDVYVALWDRGETKGGVLALRDTNSDGRADVQERFGKEGGSGIALHGKYLYFATWTTVYKYELEPVSLAPKKKPQIVLDGLPKSGHSARSLTTDAKGFLYVNIAAPSNACQKVDTQLESLGIDPCPQLENFGAIWKFDPAKTNQKQSDGERIGTGMRHIVALSTNPADGNLYGVQHGRDHLLENFPKLYTPKQAAENAAEEFFRIEKNGDYGHPYCYYSIEHGKKVLAPEYGGDGKTIGRCADKKIPLYAFPAHWAPNALLFYTGKQFPEHYKGGAFIAFHGSWFRTGFGQEGFNVVYLPFKNGQPAGNYEIFADGFAGEHKHPNRAKHRPTGLAQGPDSSLFVTDDKGGRVWKITYTGQN